MSASAFRAVLTSALLLGVSGCSTASNSAWLREPEAGMSLDADLVEPLAERHAASSIEGSDAAIHAESAPAPSSTDPAARPRLARTVTLGETLAAAEPQASPTAAGPAAAPVQVTVNNYVTVPSYDAVPVYSPAYAPRYPRHHEGGRDGGERGSRAQVKPARANIIPGSDFPAPRSYGPSFPYKTAPASPWQ